MINMYTIEWLGGFFDGEGCVSFNGIDTYFTPIVTITSTAEEVLYNIQQTLDIGGIADQRNGCFTWTVTSIEDAMLLAKALLPYLVVKKKTTEHLLNYTESRTARFKQPHTIEELDHIIAIGQSNSNKGGRSSHHFLTRAIAMREALSSSVAPVPFLTSFRSEVLYR